MNTSVFIVRRESRSRQKVTSDRMTNTGRKAKEHTMGTDQTPDNLTPVDKTPLRSRQSTSRSTVYCTVNLIKEHMSESGKVSFADISLSPDVERHYYESSHGKSAAYGLLAVVEHSVTHAVTHRKALVRKAKELINYCEEHLIDVGVGAAFPSQKTLTRNSPPKFLFVVHINRETSAEDQNSQRNNENTCCS